MRKFIIAILVIIIIILISQKITKAYTIDQEIEYHNTALKYYYTDLYQYKNIYFNKFELIDEPGAAFGQYWPSIDTIKIYNSDWYFHVGYLNQEETTTKQLIHKVLMHELAHGIYNKMEFFDKVKVIQDFQNADLRLCIDHEENFCEIFANYKVLNKKFEYYENTYKVIKKYL
jgi:hypothetical protein